MDSLQRRWSRFKDKEYRDEYAAAQFDIELPFQIQALREARGWSCKELSEHSGIPAPILTKLEETGHGALLTPDILCRLASAFDVGILVQFVSFSDLAHRAESFHPGTFKIISFDDDTLARPKRPSYQKMDINILVNLYVSEPKTRHGYMSPPMINYSGLERKRQWPDDLELSKHQSKERYQSAYQKITSQHMLTSSMLAQHSLTSE